jgi:hypothetical protein
MPAMPPNPMVPSFKQDAAISFNFLALLSVMFFAISDGIPVELGYGAVKYKIGFEGM